MKKIVALLCTLLCVLSLAACGETEDELAKKEAAAKIDESKIEMIEQYLFVQYLSLADNLSKDDAYKALVNYGNEELEYIFNDEEQSIFVDGHGLKTVVESFRLAKKNAGNLKKTEVGYFFGDVEAKISGNQIIAHALVQCENKDADVELIFSNDVFCKLEGGSLNPQSSFAELMEKAGLNTLIGMGTVFAVLILISIIIALFGLIPKIQASFAKKDKDTEEPKPVVTQAPAIVQTVEEEEDDTELVAVIAAAIAAYEGSTNTDGFVVRSIRRR